MQIFVKTVTDEAITLEIIRSTATGSKSKVSFLEYSSSCAVSATADREPARKWLDYIFPTSLPCGSFETLARSSPFSNTIDNVKAKIQGKLIVSMLVTCRDPNPYCSISLLTSSVSLGSSWRMAVLSDYNTRRSSFALSSISVGACKSS